jgi:hypothetical protein
MKDERDLTGDGLNLMDDPLLAALARLPREDLDAARTERTRMRAHRELELAVRRHASRPSAQLARLYDTVLEPTLVACYGAVALGRAAIVLAALLR